VGGDFWSGGGGLLSFGVGVTMRERRALGLLLFVFVVRLNVVYRARL